ncbi:MAG: hypothetical protein JOZ27_09010 [Caulobacteraceae bacterium]|nr:hypothetical protein [Caulobacteraceae bacterium]
MSGIAEPPSKAVDALTEALKRSRADIAAGRTVPLSEALTNIDQRVRQRMRDKRTASVE